MRKKNDKSIDSSLISQNLLTSGRLGQGSDGAAGESDDRLLRVGEAALFLNISEGALYHFISAKRVPVVRISNRCVRFSRRALSEWIESMTQKAE